MTGRAEVIRVTLRIRRMDARPSAEKEVAREHAHTKKKLGRSYSVTTKGCSYTIEGRPGSFAGQLYAP